MKTTLDWIPARCDFEVQDEADQLAGQAAERKESVAFNEIGAEKCRYIELSTIINLLKSRMQEKADLEFLATTTRLKRLMEPSTRWEHSTHPDALITQTVNKLRVGKNNLRAHSTQRHTNEDFDTKCKCPEVNGTIPKQTVKHILMECPLLERFRKPMLQYIKEKTKAQIDMHKYEELLESLELTTKDQRIIMQEVHECINQAVKVKELKMQGVSNKTENRKLETPYYEI